MNGVTDDIGPSRAALNHGVTPIAPKPGQRSVWDFPRPPAVERTQRQVEITLSGGLICRTTDVVLVLETSHPPTWYLPTRSFAPGVLRPTDLTSVCEFKGVAEYYDVVAGRVMAARSAWGYPDPLPGYEALAGRVAVYASVMDQVLVDGVAVTPQPVGFYGGWITPDVVGPFKGEPGTEGW